MNGPFSALSGAVPLPATVVADLTAALRALPPAYAVPLLLLGALAVAVGLDVVVRRVLVALVARSETTVDDEVLAVLRLPIVVTVLGVGVVLSTAVLPAELRAAVDPIVGLPALTVLIGIWAWTLHRVANRVLNAVGEGESTYAAFAPVFSNLLSFALLAGAGYAVLSVWGVDVTPLLASAGIAGIAIGFAAKDTVANFFGGIALYVDRTYKVGDVVTLDSGESGTVAKVGIRSTTLLTRDGVLVTVPNAVLNASKITNESAPGRRKRIRVPVTVAYGSPTDVVEAALLDAAADAELVLDRPPARVRLLALGENALEYELRCWVGSPTRETRARHALLTDIVGRLDAADVAIPFPQRTVHLDGGAAATDPVGNGMTASAGRAAAGPPEESGGPTGEGHTD